MSEAMDQVRDGLEAKTSSTAAFDAAVDFTGGTLGGVATVLIGQPLDTVKVSLYHILCSMYNR